MANVTWFLMSQNAVPMVANLEGRRSHECERGTQECVRHNDFNILVRPRPPTLRAGRQGDGQSPGSSLSGQSLFAADATVIRALRQILRLIFALEAVGFASLAFLTRRSLPPTTSGYHRNRFQRSSVSWSWCRLSRRVPLGGWALRFHL
jgi:hypothetical protein